ncbi:MAG: hypothetical protein ACOC2U_00130 [bacterium]
MVKRRKKSKEEMLILATDPASEFGWAISENEYGVWDLRTRKDESMGMKILRLEAKLKELHQMRPFKVLAYERPAGRHAHAIIHQAKLIGKLEEWCENNKIAYRSYSAGEIKKFATGKGNAGKPKMIEAARKLYGYQGNNDNEADALHILALAKKDLNIKK